MKEIEINIVEINRKKVKMTGNSRCCEHFQWLYGDLLKILDIL